MGEVTRFYDARIGQDGPVSGAICCIPSYFISSVTNNTVSNKITLPAGLGFQVTDITVRSGTIAGDPALTIGTSAAGTQIAASVNITTNLGALTIKDGTVSAGGLIDVRILCDGNDTLKNTEVLIFGYVTSPPTTLAYRARTADTA